MSVFIHFAVLSKEGAKIKLQWLQSRFNFSIFLLQGEIFVQEPHIRSPTQLILSLPLSQDHPRHRGKKVYVF